MQVILRLIICEATVAFDIGADTWEERGVQIRQDKIGVRDEGFPGGSGERKNTPGAKISTYICEGFVP